MRLGVFEAMSVRFSTLTFLVAVGHAGWASAAEPQLDIPWVEQMPRVPQPLHVIDWKQVARDYYQVVFDPNATGPSLPAVDLSPDRKYFGFPAYLTPGRRPDPKNGEIFTCIGGVLGAKLMDIDMHRYAGVDWLADCKNWFDQEEGLYQDRIGQRGGVVSHVVYAYWPLALGVMMSDANRQDPGYRHNADRQFAFLLQMAHAFGCPDHPDLQHGFDIGTRTVVPIQIDWNPGNASCLAWMLYAGYQWTGNRDYLECAKAALRWQSTHPGRYEMSHAMGPIAMARINAEQGEDFDMTWMMNNFFGDYTRLHGFVHQWAVTHGTNFNGLTCDGLDGAWWRWPDNNGFYAFSMNTYQSPAWVLPVARYDQRYARALARYALNQANSCRFFLGIDLDWDHQDHLDWRNSLPDGKGFLFSYEGFRTEAHCDAAHRFRPYGTGDPIALFQHKYEGEKSSQYWIAKKTFSHQSQNISLYMGNHIGFLGSIFTATDVPGIIAWDLTRTDYFRPRCYPTYLIYNPFKQEETVTFDVGSGVRDLYDTVSGQFIRRSVSGHQSITLSPDEPMVLVLTPAGGAEARDGRKLKINDVVVDFRL
jgi:hypothetical protein